MTLDMGFFGGGAPRPLAPLLKGLGAVGAAGLPEAITGVGARWADCLPGALLVDYGGDHTHDRLGVVGGPGPAARLCGLGSDERPGIPSIRVRDVRRAAGIIAARFWGHPTRAVPVVGVTGTNGKSTTVAMCGAILAAAGRACALQGTLGAQLGPYALNFGRTTLEATQWQAFVHHAAELGCGAVFTEATSGGLARGQLDPSRLEVGVFTNLGQDHLDVHGSRDAYCAAKARLFSELLAPSGTAILNGEDPAAGRMSTRARVLRFGLRSGDIVGGDLRPEGGGTVGRIETPWGPIPLALRVPGRFNVQNAMAAAGATLALGISLEAVAAGLAAYGGIAGRMEPVPSAGGPAVFVDYAHTPDALHAALTALRPLTQGALIVVFGCGGERDRGKRPEMGAVAGALADRILLTSDNPRGEDPRAIVADIEGDIPGAFEVCIDREEAIHRAIGGAGAGDTVLVAGKGHETTQTLGKGPVPFDDRSVCRAALKGR